MKTIRNFSICPFFDQLFINGKTNKKNAFLSKFCCCWAYWIVPISITPYFFCYLHFRSFNKRKLPVNWLFRYVDRMWNVKRILKMQKHVEITRENFFTLSLSLCRSLTHSVFPREAPPSYTSKANMNHTGNNMAKSCFVIDHSVDSQKENELENRPKLFTCTHVVQYLLRQHICIWIKSNDMKIGQSWKRRKKNPHKPTAKKEIDKWRAREREEERHGIYLGKSFGRNTNKSLERVYNAVSTFYGCFVFNFMTIFFTNKVAWKMRQLHHRTQHTHTYINTDTEKGDTESGSSIAANNDFRSTNITRKNGMKIGDVWN